MTFNTILFHPRNPACISGRGNDPSIILSGYFLIRWPVTHQFADDVLLPVVHDHAPVAVITVIMQRCPPFRYGAMVEAQPFIAFHFPCLGIKEP